MVLHHGPGLVDGVDNGVAVGLGEFALQTDVEDLRRIGPEVLRDVDGQVVHRREGHNPGISGNLCHKLLKHNPSRKRRLAQIQCRKV